MADRFKATALRLGLIGVLVALLLGCPLLSSSSKQGYRDDARLAELWHQTVSVYTLEPLWQPGFNYDAAHMLMLPMEHAATAPVAPSFETHMDRLFHRFHAQAPLRFDDNPLRRIQFEYLVARYLGLVDQPEPWHRELALRLVASIAQHWHQDAANHWAFTEDFTGTRERLLWKRDNPNPGHRFYRAIIDEEYYLFATAAELRGVAKSWPLALEAESRQTLAAIQQLAYEVFSREGVFDQQQRWLMQPGVWFDHRDYRYAGHAELLPQLEPEPVDDIAMDVSHSHRMPKWLKSLERGTDDPEQARFWRQARDGFEKQFASEVWEAPDASFPAPRLTNYMDGRNGVYRYQYDTMGANLGYGPWQHSGVFVWGWYAHLTHDALVSGRRALLERFPLSDQVVDLYVGPNTTRQRHPLVALPDYYRNGFAELHVRLALRLGEDRYE